MSRIAGWLALGVVVMLATAWSGEVITRTALADEAVREAAARLTFAQPTTGGDTVLLSVRLTGADGQPIARTRVEFLVRPDFFGERPISLPTAITNADGVATLKYVPTWDGAHKVTALFAGNTDYRPGEVTTVMAVSGAVATPIPEGNSLGALRLWAAPAVTLGAVIVWLIIAGVLVRVGWGVWQAGRRSEERVPALPSERAIGRLPGSTYR